MIQVSILITTLETLKELLHGVNAASSSNINLSGSIICADCKDSKGKSHHSAIYLDNYISNIEGTLKVN